MSTSDEGDTKGFEELLDYVKRSRGFDFGAYKRSSLVRRTEKRMQSTGIETYSQYCDYLEAHPQEFTHLFNTILINVTSFFRDLPTWEYLASDVIPRILATREGDSAIRVWSAGCSSGEEAYSLAILLAEALSPDKFRERVKIYATDVDEEALGEGRLASYAEQSLGSVPPDFVGKYFERSNGRYVFHRELRRSVIFGRHDLIQDPPISRVTLLVCRNTLMYFNAEVQQRILDRFHFGLRDGGFLFLGKAEMLLTRSTMFTPVDLKRRIFSKTFGPHVRNGAGILPFVHEQKPDMNPLDRVRDIALHTDPAPQLVVDRAGTVVLVNERARALFGLMTGDIGRPLQDLEVSYRPVELRSLIDQAAAERRSISSMEVEWTTPTGDRMFLTVQVTPLIDAAFDVLGAKVAFRDVTRQRRLEDDLKSSRQELETAYEELQSTNEELETTNEELQSTVEELETTNEELQSTNEELETMNEELQSTNEELQATNEQLRQSGDELNRANTFFENILNSFHGGLLVVDGELRVQAWNQQAEELWGVRAAEVQGKHLMNLDIGLPVDRLRQPVRACMSGESTFEQLTVGATNRRGRSIQVAVSCTPFGLGGNPTWGAMVTMEERTEPALTQR